MQKYGLQPILRVDTVTMAVRVVDFSNGFIKLERFLPKNQCTQRKFLKELDYKGASVVFKNQSF